METNNRTAQSIKDATEQLRTAFIEEAIGFLCNIKQEMIDEEDYEMLINFKELEDESPDSPSGCERKGTDWFVALPLPLARVEGGGIAPAECGMSTSREEQ